MTSAVYDVVSVDLEIGSNENIFRANGQTIKFPGFMSVYIEDQENDDTNSESKKLPPLEVGDQLEVNSIHGVQHFTDPPPRYSEASLVKTLEEFGIGRPSTYASIISTLQERDYVVLDTNANYKELTQRNCQRTARPETTSGIRSDRTFYGQACLPARRAHVQ